MTPQELRNSILQLAVQGKLVEQREEEGTAEELYIQMQKERRSENLSRKKTVRSCIRIPIFISSSRMRNSQILIPSTGVPV